MLSCRRCEGRYGSLMVRVSRPARNDRSRAARATLQRRQNLIGGPQNPFRTGCPQSVHGGCVCPYESLPVWVGGRSQPVRRCPIGQKARCPEPLSTIHNSHPVHRECDQYQPDRQLLFITYFFVGPLQPAIRVFPLQGCDVFHCVFTAETNVDVGGAATFQEAGTKKSTFVR